MYLTAFVVSGAIGAGLGLLVALGVLRGAGRRPGARAPGWASLVTGVGALGLWGAGALFPRLRGREPRFEGAEFTPSPYTDPFVISCGLGLFAVVVGLAGLRAGEGRRPAWIGVAGGGVVVAVWLVYLAGRLVG